MDKTIEIQTAITKQLFSTSNVAQITSISLAAILAYMQRDVIDSAVVLAWFSLIVLVALLRIVLSTVYQHSIDRDKAATHLWLVKFRVGVLCSGVVWGLASLLLFPANHPQHQMFLVFLLAGLTAGGLVSYAADLVSAIVYNVSVLAPLIVRLLVGEDSLSVAMSVALMLYLTFMILSLRYINRNVSENIILRLEATMREEAVKVSEERYRLLLNHSPVGIFHYDSSFVITYCNDRLASLLNSSVERIVGLDLKTLKDQSILPSLRKTLEGELGHYEGHYSATFSDANGWVAMTCAPSMNGKGEVVGGVAIVQDITERKASEEQNYQHNQYIRALINATSESSFLLTPDGVVLVINETALRRLHRREEDVLGNNIFDLFPPDLASKRHAILLDVVKNRKAVTVEDERAGIKFLSTYTPILDEKDETIQVAVYGTDVTERRQQEALEELLLAVNNRVLKGAPLQEVLELVCQKTVEAFGLALAWAGKKMEDGSIEILTANGPAHEYIKSLKTTGVRWDDSPRGYGPSGSAIRLREVQYRGVDDSRFSPWSEAATEQGIKSSIAVPLILGGSVFGVFCLYSRQKDQFESPALRKRIEALGDKICLALEMSAEQEQITLLSTALSSASNAVMITDSNGRIEWVNPAFVMLSGYSSVELLGSTPSILKSGKQDAAYYQHLWQTIHAGQVWSQDTTERRKDGTLYTVQQTITPILDGNGKITHFVAIHEDVTAKLDTQARIQHIASHDGLTGLPNRDLFFDRLSQLCNLSKRNQTGMALMYIDLDGFKPVNDKLGHHIGDLLLKGVAERLLACVRDSDIVARLGGDEFTITLFDITGEENISRIADKVLGELSRPFELEGQIVSIGASIGIAIASPGGHIRNDRLVERADSAMYEAKRAGKNCYRFAAEQ